MNLFILDSDVEKCAQAHIDKHVVKMPLEAAQMLCTNAVIMSLGINAPNRKLDKAELQRLREYAATQRPLSQEDRKVPYLPAMPNHPCTIWIRSSRTNWLWSVDYAFALEREYQYRYKPKTLKACDVVRSLKVMDTFEIKELTEPAQAMPDEYKHKNPITAYRNYYRGEKAEIASWKKRKAPDWWNK